MYKTLANIFISFLGAGILTLPYAFKMSGLLLGGGFLTVLALLAYYCILLLVDCKKAVEHKGAVRSLPRPGQHGHLLPVHLITAWGTWRRHPTAPGHPEPANPQSCHPSSDTRWPAVAAAAAWVYLNRSRCNSSHTRALAVAMISFAVLPACA